jgi:hypothetical protein
MAIKRYISIAGVAGILGTLALLTQPAHVTEFWNPTKHARIADPAPVPCSKQDWYNADRACQSWTAPRVEALAAASAPLLSH